MSCDIDAIKLEHAKLLRDVLSNEPASQSYEQKMRTIANAEDLIKSIESCSTEVTTSEDYTWLSTAAVQWQSVFSSVLGMPRNIEIAPPQKLVALPVETETTMADNKQVTAWIAGTAHYLAKIRRAESLLHEVGDILQRAEEGGGETDSETTIVEDWNRATVHLASEVIDGRVNLIRQLGADTYYRLESVWLKDVKELKAYFIWRRTKGAAEDNYYIACEMIRERLLACVKGTPVEFQDLCDYIDSHYLTGGAVRQDVNQIVRNIIGIKAKRVWERTGGRYNEKTNWLIAEMYTKMFYENIIPAVKNKDIEKTANVLMAFGFSKAPEHRYLVINCFEAAVAIYFLDAEIIRGLLDRNVVTWNMVL